MQTIQVRLTSQLIKKAQELVNLGLYSNKSEVIRDSLRRLCFPAMKTTKRNFNIIYSSDLHGNFIQYKKLFSRALQIKANAIILGGDLLPKDKKNRTPKKQGEFFKKKLLPLLIEFGRKNTFNCNIFLMLGNDDFKVNFNLLKKFEKIGHYKAIQNKCLQIREGFKIIGYPYVPLTPFDYKDWEKLDLDQENETKFRKKIQIKGKINNQTLKIFDLSNRKDTIEKDLNKLFKDNNPNKIILVTHSPPYNTNLDKISKKNSVGSKAIRKIIENKQPLISLHGHIHEAVNISGNFMDHLGESICINSGNDPLGKTLALIEFNLYEPQKAKRVIL